MIMPETNKKRTGPPVADKSSRSILTGTWRTLKPIIETESCNNCNVCWKYCPDLAIKIAGEYPEIDYDYCKGCGICANECPKKCIVMIMQGLE